MKYFVYTLRGAVPGKEEPWNRRLCFKADALEIKKTQVICTVDPAELQAGKLSIDTALAIEFEKSPGVSEFQYMLLEAFQVLDPPTGLPRGKKHTVVLYGYPTKA